MFDVISDVSDMRNKCIQNDIKTLCFFLFAFKMSLSKPKPKRQHTDQTLKEKIEIFGKLDCSVKAVDICKRFNISQHCLHGRNRAKINEMVDVGKVLNQKHNCKSFLPQVERALHLWFCEMRSKPHAPPINHSLLIQKATLSVFYIISDISDICNS